MHLLLEEDDNLKKLYHIILYVHNNQNAYDAKEDIKITKRHLVNMLFNELYIDGGWICNNEESYPFLRDDFHAIVSKCCENNIEYELFLIITDTLIDGAKIRIKGLDIIDKVADSRKKENEKSINKYINKKY